MIDHTTPAVLADSTKSPEIDVPAGANTLRAEPVIPDADFGKELFVDVVLRLGRAELSRARLDMNYRTRPSFSLSFDRDIQGKVEVEIIPVGGKAAVGIRVTAGTADAMPAKLEKPVRGGR